MKALAVYTLARFGLLVAVFLLLLPLNQIDLLIRLAAAFVVSMVLSWFLLRTQRDRAAVDLDRWMQRRRERRERLRAALAGEDPPAGEATDAR